ncbi:MAG: cytochrome c biosis protein CcmG, thiol:disulfide interchange protein DsbE, partial [Candidatus Eremiobacteraeota bacterium]|nr:cytochrome c biosis protein CcmG, thiol:disulfide interchange protein DsbE [Candidatus Eremiobacteraeota bacterium]
MKRLAGWVFVPVLGLGFCAAAPPAVPPSGAAAGLLPGPVVGQPAPDFALTTIDGKRVRLADYRGRTLVVNVWGSWCPPCRLETPDLVAEAKRDPRKVAFLGVDTTETASVVRAFSAAKGVPYPQAVTTGTSDFARAYEIRNYPTTFVIDPRGVLRARHADNLLPAAQLRAYIASAQRGENGVLTSAFQQQLDAMLAPAQYGLTGDSAAIRTGVAKAAQAIAKVNDLLDEAMDDPARDHDLIATQAEEQTLRAAAIAAFAPVASGDADLALLARLRGDEAAALGRWAEADAQYALALKASPDDVETLGGQAYAVSHLGDDARVAALDARIAQLAPSSSSYVSLGKALAKLRRIGEAEAAFAKAQTLAKTPAQLAWTNLYYGQTEANGHRTAQARALFARAAAAAERIPS